MKFIDEIKPQATGQNLDHSFGPEEGQEEVMEPFSPMVPPESGSGSKMPQNVFKYGAEPTKKKQSSELLEPVILNFNK